MREFVCCVKVFGWSWRRTVEGTRGDKEKARVEYQLASSLTELESESEYYLLKEFMLEEIPWCRQN